MFVHYTMPTGLLGDHPWILDDPTRRALAHALWRHGHVLLFYLLLELLTALYDPADRLTPMFFDVGVYVVGSAFVQRHW